MIDPHLQEDAPVAATDRVLREFAVLWLAVFGALAAYHGLGHGRHSTGAILAGLALTVGLLGLAKPGAIRPLFRAMLAITRPIGLVVSNMLLAILFYGLFLPIALLFKLAGRDALNLKNVPNKESCWMPRPPVTDVRRYFRQY